MKRMTAVAALVAIIVLVVVAIVVGAFLVSYILGYMSEYTRPKHLVIDEARYFYFSQKPSSILNRCVKPPCGFVLMHIYAGEKVAIIQVRFENHVWEMEKCEWETTSVNQLDVGDNIILLRNPSYNPPCIVVSKEANPGLYGMLYDILAKNGDLKLLDRFERVKVLLYSDLHIESAAAPRWLNIITNRDVYQVLVHPVLLK